MAIRFLCETCKRPINVKLELAGQEGVCPHCQEHLPIPDASALTPDAFRDAKIAWFSKHPGAGSSTSRLDDTPRTQRPLADSQTIESELTTPPRLPDPPVRSAEPGLNVAMRTVATEPSPAAMIIPQPVGPLSGQTDPFAEAPDAMWYVRPPVGGQFGPASAELFRQWIQEGRVAGDSWIWRQGWDDWQQATGLFPDLAISATGGPLDLAPGVSSPSARTRAAYFKARRRRTMWTAIGLVGGTVVVGLLIFLLVYIVRQQGGV